MLKGVDNLAKAILCGRVMGHLSRTREALTAQQVAEALNEDVAHVAEVLDALQEDGVYKAGEGNDAVWFVLG